MKIAKLRLRNFKSFGPDPTEISLDAVTYVLGPNGSGKTTVLEALARLFSANQYQRKVRLDDFHVPVGQNAFDVHKNLPSLWIEADIELPELADGRYHPSIPAAFPHMTTKGTNDLPTVRVRLTASILADGEIDESLEYIREVDAVGEPTSTSRMSHLDRRHIEVHYLPARRDPADHIKYSAASLLGRMLRATDWSAEKETVESLSKDITEGLSLNPSVASINREIEKQWLGLYPGKFFSDPSLTFGDGDLQRVLQQLTILFKPSHIDEDISFDRLSDGQKSLLYISLVLAWQSLSRNVLLGIDTSFDPHRLRPPVHTMIALEEPENSLAPHYLGRVIRQLQQAALSGDVQSVVATHAPAVLRRADPESICFLRLNTTRVTEIRKIMLPDDNDEADKYLREAIHTYPELYFSRFVVLGEGASEEAVLARLFSAGGLGGDDSAISIVPLGGRHVNHLWKLLHQLGIPFATLLDLDSGRYHGGWGRVRNAINQVNRFMPGSFTEKQLDTIPEWNAPVDLPSIDHPTICAIQRLEEYGVFFSTPLDLDLMMLASYKEAYAFDGGSEYSADLSEAALKDVFGSSYTPFYPFPPTYTALLAEFRAIFRNKSKPAVHVEALSKLSDEAVLASLPSVLERMITYVNNEIQRYPE